LANGTSRSAELAFSEAAEVLGAFGRQACEAWRLGIIGPSDLGRWVDQLVEALGSHTYKVCGMESVVGWEFPDGLCENWDEYWFSRKLTAPIRDSPERIEHLEERLCTTTTTTKSGKPSEAQIRFGRQTLRRFKEEHELTVDAIAAKINSTTSAYHAIIRGDRSRYSEGVEVRLLTLIKISAKEWHKPR